MELTELQEAYLKIQEEQKVDKAKLEEYAKKEEDWKKEKEDLMNTNHKLFLRVSNPVQQEGEEEKPKSIEEIAREYYKGE
jgi:hypothetical protein